MFMYRVSSSEYDGFVDCSFQQNRKGEGHIVVNFIRKLGDLITKMSKSNITFSRLEYNTIHSTAPFLVDGLFSTKGLSRVAVSCEVQRAMDQIIKQIGNMSSQMGLAEAKEEKEKDTEKPNEKGNGLLEAASKMLYSGAPFGVITDGNRHIPIKIKAKNDGGDTYLFEVFRPVKNQTFLLFANLIYFGVYFLA